MEPKEKAPEPPRPPMRCASCGKEHPLYNTKTTMGEGGGWRFQTLTIACECGVILSVQLLNAAPIQERPS